MSVVICFECVFDGIFVCGFCNYDYVVQVGCNVKLFGEMSMLEMVMIY